ncbi:elmo ced-12 family protein [Moniliophthora roreri]|nr:elmo ced-12 family protein [Moniliophthora roreri]
MRFSTLIVLVATFFATQVVAYNPIGQPYDTPGGFGCEQYPADVNGGVAYVYTQLPMSYLLHHPSRRGRILHLKWSDGRLSRVDR